MITKKIIISCGFYDSYEKIIRHLETIGVEVLDVEYDAQWGRYDVYTIMDREQAGDMLDFVDYYVDDGFLWH